MQWVSQWVSRWVGAGVRAECRGFWVGRRVVATPRGRAAMAVALVEAPAEAV